MITKESLQENAKYIADDVKRFVAKHFQERDSSLYKGNSLDAIWLHTVNKIYESFGHLLGEELKEDKEQSNINLRRESIFIASRIGQEWLNTFNKLKELEDLSLDGYYSIIRKKLNDHIALRDTLIDVSNEEHEKALKEYDASDSVRTVNKYTENEKSPLLESFFEEMKQDE